MDWMNNVNWFAIQAKPHREYLAAAEVAKLDIEVFLPRIRREQPICGVSRLVVKPLFAGYFFARFYPLISFDAVRYAKSVLRVLGTGRCPIPLEDEIISSIKERMQPDGFVRLQPPRFQPGDKVTIKNGPLTGWMGRVEHEWDNSKRVMILLDAIQQSHVLAESGWLDLEVNG